MINRIIVLFCLLGALPVLCRAAAGPGENPSASGKYITAAQYLVLHPEQKETSEAFSRMVQESAQPLASGKQKQPVRVAVIYPGDQVSDYWRRSLGSFSARMQELGIHYELHDFFSKGGGGDIRRQEEQIREALNWDPDYLVFTLDVAQHERIIEHILVRGRPRLILQNITTPLAAWEGNQPFYVGFDHAIGTAMLADYFLKTTPPGSQYGLLYFSQGYVSSMRGDTFRQFMENGRGAALAGAYYTDGQRKKAREATVALLQEHANLAFIYACATDMALGAADALREAGLTGKIPVNGWGGGDAELAALNKGELQVTVMRINDDNGVAMAEAIHLALQGRDKEIPTVFSGDFALITKDTSAQDIEALKQRAFRYSGIAKP